MKIVIDLQSCQSGSRFGGIGRYALQLTKAMAREAHDDDIWVVLNNQLPDAIEEIRRELSSSLPQNKIITFESISRVDAMASEPFSFRTRAVELCREHFIAQLRPDVVYVASLFEGLHEDVVASVANVSAPHATAVTLYDLIPLVQQKKYLVDDVSKAHYMRKVSQLTRADVLLAISAFSRDEGRQLLDYPSERIVNMSSASGDCFRPVQMNSVEKSDVLARFGIKNRFLMYTGSFDQRKNQKNLIEAFSLLTAKSRAEFQLVIVGNGWHSVYEELRAHGAMHGLAGNNLVFTGKIEDNDLLKLYNLCFLFVFPSLSEGFGLPILEAMSCGTPAIGSNATSIPEVIGRADALFDPTSPSSIAAKIMEVIQTPSFYKSLHEHALVQAKRFSWEKSARIALNAFREFAPRTSCSFPVSSLPRPEIDAMHSFRSQVIDSIAAVPNPNGTAQHSQVELAGSIAINDRLLSIASISESYPAKIDRREHLGLVTSWGTKCGVAEYSKWLMRSMPFEFTVFAPRSELLVASGEKFVLRCWAQNDEDDLSALLQGIRESLVTTVLFQFHYGFYSFPALAKLIAALHACEITTSIQLHSTVDPPEHISVKKLSALAATFRTCANIFVTTQADVLRLRDIGVVENVKVMPLGVNRARAASVPYSRGAEDFVISSYGFFLPHKGVHELIRAVAILRASIPNVKLLLVNSEYPIAESRLLVQQGKEIVNELGLEECVTFVTDYLTDEESVGYLTQSNLIVYPYQHTTEPASAAVRLGIASGVPIAVTPSTIFEDVRELVHTLPGASVTQIANGIAKIHDDISANSSTITRVRDNCSRWLNIHDYSNLTKHLYSAIAVSNATKKGFRSHLHFSATDPKFGTHVGTHSKSGLCSSGRTGILLFGPYINLESGTYTISIFGASDAADIWDAISLKLLHGENLIEVKYERQQVGMDAKLLEIAFKLETKVTRFEIQVGTNGRHFVEFVDIAISSNRKIH